MFLNTVVWPFLINWLILFVAVYIVTEYGHYNLYDEGPPGMLWRVGLASALFAAFLTWRPLSFDTMFTNSIHWTILHGIVWFLAFLFILRFHPRHGLALSVATLLLVPGLAGLAVDSMTKTSHQAPVDINRPNKPFRQGMPANPSSAASEPAAEKSK